MTRSDPQPPLLVGLIGAGIQASLSPAMHEHEGIRQGLRLTYRPIDLERLRLGPEAPEELPTAAGRMLRHVADMSAAAP